MKAKIFEIKRFAVHDGDGIRTTAFFSGCPLKCKWCHNPEGISLSSTLAFYKNKCLSCGECISSCANNAHYIENGSHLFNRSACALCGKCASACPSSALVLYGKDYEIDELLPLLLEDEPFYSVSDGGVTVSGGEPLLQYPFVSELLKRLKEQGVNTAVDTCGMVKREAFDAVLPYTDTFLFDLKAIDEQVHIDCTGVSNALILSNLRYLDEKGASVEIRIPFVPGYNDGEIDKIARFISTLSCVKRIRLLGYHDYAGSKYDALSLDYPAKNATVPDRELLTKLREKIQSVTGIKTTE